MKIFKSDCIWRIDARLAERNFGVWEGKNKKNLWQFLKKNNLNFADDNFRPFHGETRTEFRQRVCQSINDMINSCKNQSVLVVSHGGTIHRIFEYFEIDHRGIDNASISIVNLENGRLTSSVLNNTTHLK